MESRHDPHPHDIPGIPESLHRAIEAAHGASTDALLDRQSELTLHPTTPQQQDELGVIQQEILDRVQKGTLDQGQHPEV